MNFTRSVVPDARIEVLDAFRAGDRIAVRWTFSGTPDADFAPGVTGRSFSVPGSSVFELQGREIQRVSDYYNLADLNAQIGL